ncbi:hypothetical protein O181_106568 [Austropuccinia psidii MF-1]|uniref:Uncharacterized protein n=1 Tax=Austropuccinia psidii MF-1 TaxID=1389203 RepID=A0A9Q3PM35_9BASI|nr:hypothetical protein [Austropuccinia psidii MF-1]
MDHGEQQGQPRSTMERTCSRHPEHMFQRDTIQRHNDSHQRLEYQQAVQTSRGKGSQDKEESSLYLNHRRTNKLDREYFDSLRLTRSKPIRLQSGFTPVRHQYISDQESPFFAIPHSFQEETRIKGEKQELFQP